MPTDLQTANCHLQTFCSGYWRIWLLALRVAEFGNHYFASRQLIYTGRMWKACVWHTRFGTSRHSESFGVAWLEQLTTAEKASISLRHLAKLTAAKVEHMFALPSVARVPVCRSSKTWSEAESFTWSTGGKKLLHIPAWSSHCACILLFLGEFLEDWLVVWISEAG